MGLRSNTWCLGVAGQRLALFTAAFGSALLAATGAMAHEGHSHNAGLVDGLLHPLTGPDHLLAALAIGILAARRDHALGSAPLAFLMMLSAGFGLAHIAAGLPLVELMVLGSVLVLAGMAIGARHIRLSLTLGVVAVFGLFHGYAHGVAAAAGGAAMFFLGVIGATAALIAGAAALTRIMTGRRASTA